MVCLILLVFVESCMLLLVNFMCICVFWLVINVISLIVLINLVMFMVVIVVCLVGSNCWNFGNLVLRSCVVLCLLFLLILSRLFLFIFGLVFNDKWMLELLMFVLVVLVSVLVGISIVVLIFGDDVDYFSFWIVRWNLLVVVKIIVLLRILIWMLVNIGNVLFWLVVIVIWLIVLVNNFVGNNLVFFGSVGSVG